MGMNYLAILVSGVAATAIGSFWYSPHGFGKAWMKLSGIDMKKVSAAKKKGMGWKYFASFITTLVMAVVLKAFLSAVMPFAYIPAALFIGFLLWLGFVATVEMGVVLWEGKPFRLFLINAGHYLVTLLAMSAILAAWR